MYAVKSNSSVCVCVFQLLQNYGHISIKLSEIDHLSRVTAIRGWSVARSDDAIIKDNFLNYPFLREENGFYSNESKATYNNFILSESKMHAANA